MKLWKKFNILYISCFLFLMVPMALAQGQLPQEQIMPPFMAQNIIPKIKPIDCVKTFNETNQCPAEQCKYGCFTPSEDGVGCFMACIDKPCLEFDAQSCPPHRCDVLESCEQTQVCYPKLKDLAGSCGGLGFVGQNVPCCEGLVKRCGVEFFDGTCDMAGRNSIYSVSTCIACGNGICEQFEQTCNCPEDCKRYTP